ncbi:MAG: MoaD/ThiS family protein [Chloroflexi bacterium]|nr:MoaD/ThiS family protein [Chloroflexota bacterium]
MVKARVTALQSVRRAIGWSSREVDFAGGTLEDLLRQIQTGDGQTLYDFLVENGELKPDYAVIVNGDSVAARGPSGLSMHLTDNDEVVAMAVLSVMSGGSSWFVGAW